MPIYNYLYIIARYRNIDWLHHEWPNLRCILDAMNNARYTHFPKAVTYSSAFVMRGETLKVFYRFSLNWRWNYTTRDVQLPRFPKAIAEDVTSKTPEKKKKIRDCRDMREIRLSTSSLCGERSGEIERLSGWWRKERKMSWGKIAI